jgi:hypothetical protein
MNAICSLVSAQTWGSSWAVKLTGLCNICAGYTRLLLAYPTDPRFNLRTAGWLWTRTRFGLEVTLRCSLLLF